MLKSLCIVVVFGGGIIALKVSEDINKTLGTLLKKVRS
jgi:hypothetical protein